MKFETEIEKELHQILQTLYSVVIGYQSMPGETIHPMTKEVLEQTKHFLNKYEGSEHVSEND